MRKWFRKNFLIITVFDILLTKKIAVNLDGTEHLAQKES